MSEKKTPAADRVAVYIPRRIGEDEPNFFVGVNGKNYVLPKGEESMVPPEVAEEIRRAFRAQSALDKMMDRMKIVQ